MLDLLHAYYDAKGIGAVRFACPHRHRCGAGSPGFTTAKEAHVGTAYEAGTLPRVLFLSLDSGSADSDPSTRTLEASRAWLETVDVLALPKGRHWRETTELARYLLRPFKRDLTIERVGPYFAHTNSAKCCQNKDGRAQADDVLFRNCRAFIPEELRILQPDILITQGGPAREVVAGIPIERRIQGPVGAPHSDLAILRLTPSRRTLWFHSLHPAERTGGYRRQKDICWPFLAQEAQSFVRTCGSERPPRPAVRANVPVSRVESQVTNTLVQATSVAATSRPEAPPRPRPFMPAPDPRTVAHDKAVRERQLEEARAKLAGLQREQAAQQEEGPTGHSALVISIAAGLTGAVVLAAGGDRNLALVAAMVAVIGLAIALILRGERADSSASMNRRLIEAEDLVAELQGEFDRPE